MLMGLEEKISDEEIRESRRLSHSNYLKSLSAGLAVGIGSTLWHREGHLISQPWYSLLHGSLAYGLLATTLAQPINFFSPWRFRATIRGISAGLAHFGRGNFEQKKRLVREKNIAFIKEIVPTTKDPLVKKRMHVLLDIAHENYESALRRAVPLLHAYKKAHPMTSMWHALHDKAVSLAASLTGFQRHLPFHLEHGLEMLAKGRERSAERHLSYACNLDHPLRIPMNCFLGHYLNLSAQGKPKDHKKSQEQWQSTIHLVLQDPSLVQQFRRLGESRHEVLEISGEGILKDTFVFKRDIPSDYLTKEYTLDQLLYTLFGDQESVAQPLASLVHEGKQYLILRRVAGRTFDYTNHSSDDDLLRFMPFLSAFHKQLEAHRDHLPKGILAPRDYALFLQEKYTQRVPAEQHKPKVIAAIDHLAQELDAQPRNPIHGDLHPGNIFIHDRGFTLLDPEHMCLATRDLDLASLLEHDQLALSERELEQALQSYYQEETGSPKSFEERYRQYLPNALFRSLHTRGIFEGHSYGYAEQEHRRLKDYYEQRAHVNMGHLKRLDKRAAEKLEHLLLA